MTKHEEIAQDIRNILDKTADLTQDEFTKYSIYDELNNYLVNALNMLHKLDMLEDTKNTREIFYLTTEYRYSECDERVFLVSHFAHSLHELREMHIYELTLDRHIQSRDAESLSVDYTHKVIVIADFDYTNCASEFFKIDFKDELADSFFDCRFDTLNFSIKQLS